MLCIHLTGINHSWTKIFLKNWQPQRCWTTSCRFYRLLQKWSIIIKILRKLSLIRIIIIKSSIFCPAFEFFIAMWWADLGQLPYTHPVLPTTFSQQNGQKIRQKSSWAKIKTGRSLTSYCQRENRCNLGKKNYLNLFPIKVDLDGGKQKLNTLPSPWLLFPASTSLFHSQLLYLPALTGVRGWGNRGVRISPWQIISPLMLFPCSSLSSPGTAGNSVQAHGIPSPPHLHPGACRAVSHTFFPSLVSHGHCPAHPYTHFPRGTAIVSGGLSHTLQWVSWSSPEPAMSDRGQVPHCLSTQHRFTSKMWVN